MELHWVLNGQNRLLKCFIKGASAFGKPDGLLHQFEAHDVGVNDYYVTQGQDVYGHHCKCPPGDYGLGRPQKLDPPERAYGFYFTPLTDTSGAMAAHGRDGIGVHGGGSDLPNPFADRQGWEYTYGCVRLQNEDNEQFVATSNWAMDHGAAIKFTVVWP